MSLWHWTRYRKEVDFDTTVCGQSLSFQTLYAKKGIRPNQSVVCGG